MSSDKSLPLDPATEDTAGEANDAHTDKRKPLGGFTIAIVGADGSGKSTIANMLLDAMPESTKYMYMGASTDASNVTLPTSRLLARYKRRRLARHIDHAQALPPAAIMSDEMKNNLPKGRIVKALGVINRIAEEWYRQLHVWIYGLRGYVVVCDRHFLYEYFPDSETLRSSDRRFSVRLHAAMLSRLYPKPALTVFLDAPPEVLFARKPEWTVEHLARQRAGILEQGGTGDDFHRIDATRSVESVYANVQQLIGQYRSAR